MAAERLGPERIQIAPSCSLMHVPLDLDEEVQLDPDVRPCSAFGRQKLEELTLLARAAVEDDPAIREQLARNRAIVGDRRRNVRACTIQRCASA